MEVVEQTKNVEHSVLNIPTPIAVGIVVIVIIAAVITSIVIKKRK